MDMWSSCWKRSFYTSVNGRDFFPGNFFSNNRGFTCTRKKRSSARSLYFKIEDKEFLEDDIRKCRVHTEDFDVAFPKYAMFGVTKEGPTKAIADGYHIITEPLTKGNYTINYKSSILCMGLDCTEQSFAHDITYNMIVK